MGRDQRNKVMKYGEGPQRVRFPWAPNVLAKPLLSDAKNLTDSDFESFMHAMAVT